MDSSSERLTVLIFDGLNQALASVDSFVALDDRTLITAEIAARLHYAGVTLPHAVDPSQPCPRCGQEDVDGVRWVDMAEQCIAPDCPGSTAAAATVKPRDLGPQTFGPAPGSDGDTRDWDNVQ